MATVFGNKRTLLTAALLAVCLLLVGCGSLPTTKSGNAAVKSGPASSSQHVFATGDVAPLPRQRYDSAGERIPYQPEPNPYTAGSGEIPNEARALFTTAKALAEDDKTAEAEKRFAAITEKFPSLSGPWVRLGALAEQSEKIEEAEQHYRKAIEVNADNVNAYIALGLLQRREGHFADAQDTYLKALDVWTDFPEAHLNLAILYDLYANQPERAQKHYEAYYFLTGEKDESARLWLVEVRQRTGIEKSFIDNPPETITASAVDNGEGGDHSEDTATPGVPVTEGGA